MAEPVYGFPRKETEDIAATVRRVQQRPNESIRQSQNLGGQTHQFVRITSSTAVSGRYPGKWLLYDEEAKTWSDGDSGETIWIVDPNGFSLATDVRYPARLWGKAGSPERLVWIVMGAGAGADINSSRHRGCDPFARVYNAGVTTNTTADTWQPQANRIYALPIYAPAGEHLDYLQIHVATASGSGGMVRLGIYRATDIGNKWPSALVLDAGELDVSTTGIKRVAVNVDLDPILLQWLVIIHNTASPTAEIHAQEAIDYYPVWGVDPCDMSGLQAFGHAINLTYAALPATFPDAGSHIFLKSGYAPKLGMHFSHPTNIGEECDECDEGEGSGSGSGDPGDCEIAVTLEDTQTEDSGDSTFAMDSITVDADQVLFVVVALSQAEAALSNGVNTITFNGESLPVWTTGGLGGPKFAFGYKRVTPATAAPQIALLESSHNGVAAVAFTLDCIGDEEAWNVNGGGTGTSTDPQIGSFTSNDSDSILIALLATEGPGSDTDGSWINGFTDVADVGTTSATNQIKLHVGVKILSGVFTGAAGKTGATSRAWGSVCYEWPKG